MELDRGLPDLVAFLMDLVLALVHILHMHILLVHKPLAQAVEPYRGSFAC